MTDVGFAPPPSSIPVPSGRRRWLSIDGKTLFIIAMGGVSIIAVYALASQWKHATLGRQVRRNVVRFLGDYGAVTQNGVMFGGIMDRPTKVDTAVNAVIVQLLNDTADELQKSGASTISRDPTDIVDPYSVETYAQRPPQQSTHQRHHSGSGSASRHPRVGDRQSLEISKIMTDDSGYSHLPSGKKGGRKHSGSGRDRDRDSGLTTSFEYDADDMTVGRHRRPEKEKIFSDEESAAGSEAPGPAESAEDSDYQ